MAENTSKWGKATAAKRYASGGRFSPQVATASAELENHMAANPEPGALNFASKANDSPSSRYERLGPGLAEDARNVAAHRTRNSRAMPEAHPVGGNKRGGKVK